MTGLKQAISLYAIHLPLTTSLLISGIPLPLLLPVMVSWPCDLVSLPAPRTWLCYLHLLLAMGQEWSPRKNRMRMASGQKAWVKISALRTWSSHLFSLPEVQSYPWQTGANTS